MGLYYVFGFPCVFVRLVVQEATALLPLCLLDSHTTESTCADSELVAGQPHSIRQGQQKTTTATSRRTESNLQGKQITSEQIPILLAVVGAVLVPRVRKMGCLLGLLVEWKKNGILLSSARDKEGIRTCNKQQSTVRD